MALNCSYMYYPTLLHNICSTSEQYKILTVLQNILDFVQYKNVLRQLLLNI